MRVNLQLEPEPAPLLHRYLQAGQRALEGSEDMGLVVAAVRRHNGKIAAVHPGQSHPLLAPFFSVETKTQEDAERLIAELQGIRGVAGVYLSPEPETP